MTNTRFWAIDPGPHTAFVEWNPRDDVYVFETLDFTTFDASKSKYNAPHEELWAYLNRSLWWDELTLICEKFEYQKEKAQEREALNYDAAEYVGTVKTWYYVKAESEFDQCKLVMQSPSMAVGKSCFWTDDKLKKLGLWRSIKHERDALRHLLYYRTFTLGDQSLLYKLK